MSAPVIDWKEAKAAYRAAGGAGRPFTASARPAPIPEDTGITGSLLWTLAIAGLLALTALAVAGAAP